MIQLFSNLHPLVLFKVSMVAFIPHRKTAEDSACALLPFVRRLCMVSSCSQSQSLFFKRPNNTLFLFIKSRNAVSEM